MRLSIWVDMKAVKTKVLTMMQTKDSVDEINHTQKTWAQYKAVVVNEKNLCWGSPWYKHQRRQGAGLGIDTGVDESRNLARSGRAGGHRRRAHDERKEWAAASREGRHDVLRECGLSQHCLHSSINTHNTHLRKQKLKFKHFYCHWAGVLENSQCNWIIQTAQNGLGWD